MVVAAGYASGGGGPPRHQSGSLPAATFIYCVRGGGWCETGGRLAAVRRGDLLVLPPRVAYSCGTHASNPWTVHWARAAGALLPQYLDALGFDLHSRLLHVGEAPQAVRLFNEVFRSLGEEAGFGGLLEASSAFAYLLSLWIARRRERSPGEAVTIQKVAGAIIYMSEHLDEPVRVAALAREASLSPAYFGELFKSQTGCSPRDYLHLLRIHRACQLLAASTLSIKEIATRVGYRDPFHFSRQFKAFQGLAPSDYRQSRAGLTG
jgi:AraC-like DNA-binding protein